MVHYPQDTGVPRAKVEIRYLTSLFIYKTKIGWKVIMSNQLVDPATFLQKAKPEMNSLYPWTDLGNGQLFADCYKSVARYVKEKNCWYCYRNGIWVQDLGNLQVMAYAKQMANALKRYCNANDSDGVGEKYRKHCKMWQNRSVRETVLKEAKDVYPLNVKDFDSDPNILNCRNGTLHLDTMTFTPHRSEDFLTRQASVDYDPSAECVRYQQFVDEIMSGDKEKSRYLQKALGYALTGNTRFECMFFLWGETTRNGKGTLCESVLKVLGSYGCGANAEILAMKPYVNSHSPSEDIARLDGVRYINIPEPEKGLVLNAAQIKKLTGNDTVNARFLHENSFNFCMQVKLYVNTNHLPVINDVTLFTSGRIWIIPFCRHFSEHEQDKHLKEFFQQPKNQSAILNWLIEGYNLLKEEGLQPPASVLAATGIYQEDSDDIHHFVREALIEIPGAEVRTAEVYARYCRWCEENGIPAENGRNFNAGLRSIAEITRKRPKAGGGQTTMLLGYQLVPTETHNE